MRPDMFSWSVNASEQRTEEVRHVVFIKVHKAASTTLFNIFIRFSISRELNVMFPLIRHILSEKKSALSQLIPYPPSPPFLFDILCNHFVFDYEVTRRYFPIDTKYVAILRDPWHQVESAFYYYTYRSVYLTHGFNFTEFVLNQTRYEPKDPLISFTNNRMSLDLGLSPSHIGNPSYTASFLSHLDRVIDLVLIVERFDESLVIMRRMLRWTTKDIIYIKLNSRRISTTYAPKPDEVVFDKFRRLQHADIALYSHYSKIFEKKLAQEGPDFWDELQTFKDILSNTSKFCGQNVTGSEMIVPASKWNARFSLKRAECDIMSADELPLNQWTKFRQLSRMNKTAD